MRAFLAAVLVSGCAQTLDFHECEVDTDCPPNADGGLSYCTSDKFCVGTVPMARLCPDVIPAPAGGPVLAVMSLVDRTDPLDQAMENAFRLAVSEINLLQAGANQPGIELHICDMGTVLDGSQSFAAVTFAVQQFHVAAVLGPTATADVVAITSLAKEHGILVISPSATAILISSLDSGHQVWRTAPSDALQAAKLTDLVQMQMPAPTVTDILYADSLDNKALEQAFFTDFITSGMFTVKNTFSFSEGGNGLTAAMTNVSADNPAALVAVSDSDDPAILAAVAAQPNLGATKIYMTDSAKVPPLLAASVPASIFANLQGTGPGTPSGPTFTLFQTAYKNRFGVDPKDSNFSANAYDAAYLVAVAAAGTKGHVPSGTELSASLRTLQKIGTPVPVGSNDYLTAVNKMASGGVRLDGASGPLDFDLNGDLMTGHYEVWGVDTTGSSPIFMTITP
jgi:branched-chain amino acid transport system substrate-binding protein